MQWKEEKLKIILHNGNVCFASDVVEGVVELRVYQTMIIREVRLEAEGKIHTQWTEGKEIPYFSLPMSLFAPFYRLRRYTERYHATSYCLEVRIPLFAPSEEDEHKILPGFYELPFKFYLPYDCPSSFEGEFGYIRYTLKVTHIV